MTDTSDDRSKQLLLSEHGAVAVAIGCGARAEARPGGEAEAAQTRRLNYGDWCSSSQQRVRDRRPQQPQPGKFRRRTFARQTGGGGRKQPAGDLHLLRARRVQKEDVPAHIDRLPEAPAVVEERRTGLRAGDAGAAQAGGGVAGISDPIASTTAQDPNLYPHHLPPRAAGPGPRDTIVTMARAGWRQRAGLRRTWETIAAGCCQAQPPALTSCGRKPRSSLKRTSTIWGSSHGNQAGGASSRRGFAASHGSRCPDADLVPPGRSTHWLTAGAFRTIHGTRDRADRIVPARRLCPRAAVRAWEVAPVGITEEERSACILALRCASGACGFARGYAGDDD